MPEESPDNNRTAERKYVYETGVRLEELGAELQDLSKTSSETLCFLTHAVNNINKSLDAIFPPRK